MVPFNVAMPKKKVTPATRIRMLTGNPAMTSRSVMPATVVPTRQADDEHQETDVHPAQRRDGEDRDKGHQRRGGG